MSVQRRWVVMTLKTMMMMKYWTPRRVFQRACAKTRLQQQWNNFCIQKISSLGVGKLGSNFVPLKRLDFLARSSGVIWKSILISVCWVWPCVGFWKRWNMEGSIQRKTGTLGTNSIREQSVSRCQTVMRVYWITIARNWMIKKMSAN